MGFVGFLKFSLRCFHLLAWPLFAMVYPLYSSIRAIETNSIVDMRNLVAYWILFSLISLFELAFARLIEWLPIWPSIKLMTICWLVLPHFEGAHYVYEHLVYQCISLKPHVIKQFINPKEDALLNAECFLAAAERYVKENGSEALEKLIATKNKHMEPNLDVEEIKAVKITDKKETTAATHSNFNDPYAKENAIVGEPKEKNLAASTEKVKPVEPNISQTLEKTVAPAGELEINEKAVAGEIKVVETPASEKIQKEWTCAVCQVTTTNENTFNFHLQGGKHQSKFEQPCFANEDAKAVELTESNPSATIKWSDFKDLNAKENNITGDSKEKNLAAATERSNFKDPKAKENPMARELKEKNLEVAEERVKCLEPNLAPTEERIVAEAGEIKGKAVAGEIKAGEIHVLEKVQKEWTCALCQVRTTSEKTLNEHLQGRKHLEKCEVLKASKLATKNKGCSPSTLNQEPKKSVPPGDSRNRNRTKKQEEKLLVKQSKFWCSICNVRCPDGVAMEAHLRGKKHLSRIQEIIDSSPSGWILPDK